DVSFGIGVTLRDQALVSGDASVKYWIPTSEITPDIWGAAEFDDSAWKDGVNGIGFANAGAVASETAFSEAILKLNRAGFWHLDEPAASTIATNAGSAGASLNLTYSTGIALGQASMRPTQFKGFGTNNTSPKFDGVKTRAVASSGPLSGRSSFAMSGW